MGKVVADITMSLDGFVTGPGDAPGRGLGEGGERLHNWVMGGPLAPVLLGAGRRLFENPGDQVIELERTRVIESPYATHLAFSVRR